VGRLRVVDLGDFKVISAFGRLIPLGFSPAICFDFVGGAGFQLQLEFGISYRVSFAVFNSNIERIWCLDSGKTESIKETLTGFLARFCQDADSLKQGHGPVGANPDRPYLLWRFKYEHARNGNGNGSGLRNNQETYLEGLQKLYGKLSKAACKQYAYPNPLDLPIDEIKAILAVKGRKHERVEAWKDFIADRFGDNIEYRGSHWEHEKEDFNKIGNCYRFHQAAAYHRWYTLKDLLPEHGIYVV